MTYSIVARDPQTGELGVAVQSHYFSVGPIVPWAEAGVGAVATQAFAEVSYGPEGLALMRAGQSAHEALDALVAADADAARRQVAVVDASGNVATHTGLLCIAAAGHRTAEAVSVQANMMERETVPDAMLSAYEAATGDFAAKLLTALVAAEAEGGDIRGKQSIAMLIVGGERKDKPWQDRRLELRVEDHADPLGEMERLLQLHRAYRVYGEAEEAAVAGDMATATVKLEESLRLAPGNPEIAFWAAIGAATKGQIEVAKKLLARATEHDPRWPELVRRLPPTGMFDLSDETVRELLGD